MTAATSIMTDNWTDEDLNAAMEGVRALLRLAGMNPEREGLQETPARYVKAWLELTESPGDPAAILSRTFGDIEYPTDQMVALGPIDFTSVCEHHLLPFTGQAWVGYIPGVHVVGLSKLARLVDHYARRPQVQERLTTQIAAAIDEHLAPNGAAVVIKATHSCMTLRGVRKTGGLMTTSAMHGAFRTNPATRAEFMALTQGGRA